MKTRPKSLLLLSIVLLGIAISFPVQIFFLFEQDLSEWQSVLYKLTPLNWACMFALIASSFCVYNAMPQTLPISFFTILLVNWNNFIAGTFEINYSLNTTVLASLSFFFVHYLLFTDESRKVLFNPKLRWWKYPLRKQAQISVRVRRLNGQVFSATTHDISNGGAFIPFFSVEAVSEDQLMPPLIPNDEECVMLDFAVDQTAINCQAKVVRKSLAQGSYPAGIGVQFLDLESKEKRILNRYIKDAPINVRQTSISP